MENFEEMRHHNRRDLTYVVRPELRFYNHHYHHNSTGNMYGLPTLILQFEIYIEEDLWCKQAHRPSQFIYKPEHHHTYTLSFDVKLSPSQYTSHDVFFSILEQNLSHWSDNNSFINRMIIHIEDELNKCGDGTNCKFLEMFVDMNVKLEYIWDVRLQEAPSPSPFTEGMVPASKTSIMELPDRMEIDNDQCLKDVDCVICLQQLEGGEKIVCMPCSHMFHGDCIKTWLDKSHYCPICRYDMPTTST